MTTQFSTDPVSTGYLRISQILQLIPIGRSTWWQWVSIGKAPKPLKFGPRITVWRAEDIAEFIQLLDQTAETQSNDQ